SAAESVTVLFLSSSSKIRANFHRASADRARGRVAGEYSMPGSVLSRQIAGGAHDAFIQFLQPAELFDPLFQRQAVDGPYFHRSVEPIGRLPRREIEIAVAFRQNCAVAEPAQLVVDGLQVQLHTGSSKNGKAA